MQARENVKKESRAGDQPEEDRRDTNGADGAGGAVDLHALAVPVHLGDDALRGLVAGLASGSPDYDKLSPQFAEIVRRDLPMTRHLFSSMGALKSVTFSGRGAMGDDVYNLAFANGGVMMSAALDADGRMAGGILKPVAPPKR